MVRHAKTRRKALCRLSKSTYKQQKWRQHRKSGKLAVPVPTKTLISLHKKRLQQMVQGDFTFNFLERNPLIQAAENMYLELESVSSRICGNCSEQYSVHTADKDTGKCTPCLRKVRREKFSPMNDVTPSPSPPCLSDLTQVEKSSISIICPSIAVYRKGTSTAANGHTISFYQDVETLAKTLPRLPADLPFIILKDPRQNNVDVTFRVRRQKIIDALIYLKAHNEDYRSIDISLENAAEYPEDDIFQNLPQLDPRDLNIQEEAPTAANEESAREQMSTVDVPIGQLSAVENMRESLQKEPHEAVQPLPWPRRSDRPVSEFIRGYFSMAFPDLFPDGRGDITKPRKGKNPTKREYFAHLLKVSRSFVKHHSFLFVATNILLRHEALTRGNVFAKRCADGLSMTDLKKLLEEGNQKLINKLMYFSAPIAGTKQYLRFQADKAVSFVKFVRITSDDKDMFTLFQTFSAADLHWDDFHRTLPESVNYLGKRVVTESELGNLSEADKSMVITAQEDHRLRMKAIQENPDKVDSYFNERLNMMLKHVMPVLGATDWIIRFEAQARGTIHAHLLIRIQNGPSHDDLQQAKTTQVMYDKLTDEEKQAVDGSREKIIKFSCADLGISAVHPNPDPCHWPGPYGQDVHTPAINILRQRFLDISKSPAKLQDRYERLVNRVMLHHCREGYCLKTLHSGEKVCRFQFPMRLIGFQTVYSADGKTFLRPDRVPGEAECGGEHKGELLYLRNHPTIVHHIAELLTIWGANIEGRTVNSYKQVLKYLLKYMYKNEPNSQTFQAITKAIIDNAGEEVPVRKTFQQILMKTLKQHDLSKQECARILNGGDFVQTSRDFVCVNCTGTRKVMVPTGAEMGDANILEDNLAFCYWNRENDPHYQAAVESFKSGQASEDPEKVTLFSFVSKYTKRWKMHGNVKVPHITPNFNRVPNKHILKEEERYVLFLKTTLLVHKAGTKLSDYAEITKTQLETEIQAFVESHECPKLIYEEFLESQTVQESDIVEDDGLDSDRECDESQLLVEPDVPKETYPQDPWMGLLCPIQTEECLTDIDDAENCYDEFVGQLESENIDWQNCCPHLHFSQDDLKMMPGWLESMKGSFSLRASNVDGGLPEQLNCKQLLAFKILQQQIQIVVEQGINKAQQLLLNISGSAGTGKSFWLNCLRKYIKDQQLSTNLIQAAAPSGTAAYQIGGQTLHGMLYLPIGNGELKPLSGSSLANLQEAFKDTAILVIDEKSMIGLKTFFNVSERLKEAKPHRSDEPFGGLTVVLLGDWKQLPPVMDSPLYHNPSRDKQSYVLSCKAGGYNLYRLFKHVVIFEQIERQAGADQALFRNELRRLGEGRFTEKDWERWQERDINLLSPMDQKVFRETAVMACAYTKDMVRHNIARVKANGEPIALIRAESNPKREATKEGSDRECGLPSKIALCKGTVFRLSCNLWTDAGLTNGAVGKVHAIIYAPNTKPPQLPVAIIGIFENYCGPSFLPDVPKSVPISPVRRTWFSNRIQCSRVMLPVILGYALSIHKLQGATLEKVILNAGPKEFALGLLFVGASRVKRFEGLALDPFPNYDRFAQIGRCKSLQERLKEEKRMRKLEEDTLVFNEGSLAAPSGNSPYLARNPPAVVVDQIPTQAPSSTCTLSSDGVRIGERDRSRSPIHSRVSKKPRKPRDVKRKRSSKLEIVYQSHENTARLPTGLDNLDNTCYMNSILQCLFNIGPVSEYFLNVTIFPDGDDVAREYATLVSNLWACPQKSVQPNELKKAIDKRKDIFQGNRQQDAHEFLHVLTDCLEDHAPIVADMFNTEVESTMTCLTCHEQSEPMRQVYTDMSLPIPTARDLELVSLRECVDTFFLSTADWECPSCDDSRRAQQRLKIVRFPDFLIIHLMRFEQDPITLQHRKKETNVSFQLSNFKMADHGKAYNLCGVVNHYGSLEFGHYTANCYSSVLKRWHTFNDSQVHPIHPSCVLTKDAYILFFSSVPFEFN